MVSSLEMSKEVASRLKGDIFWEILEIFLLRQNLTGEELF